MFSSFSIIYLLLSIALSGVIGIYAWRNHKTRGSRAFASLCLFAIVWMTSEALGSFFPDARSQWIREYFRFFGAISIPSAMFMFTLQYCGRNGARRVIAASMIVPAISYIVLATNSLHFYFFEQSPIQSDPGRIVYGPYYWFVHVPFSYLLLISCLFTVLVEVSRASRYYRRQIIALFLSLCIPTVVNILVVLGVVGRITVYSFPIFFVVTAYSIFRLQFLGSSPIAYETVFLTIRDGVLILDVNDIIRDVNPAVAKSLRRKPREIIGQHLRDAFADWPSAVELYDADPDRLGHLEVELFGSQRFLKVDSMRLDSSEGRIITIRDVTDSHRQQLSLETMAFHDSLTRVANRRKFQEEVDRAIATGSESGEPFAILYFDLNGFKSINDTYGHETGDELLRYVAARVASILRKPDLVARLGGDEFALLLHDCDEAGAQLVIDRVLDNVLRPFEVGDLSLTPNLSIGASYYPKNGETLNDLLRAADGEMYRAKLASRASTGPVIDVTSNLAA